MYGRDFIPRGFEDLRVWLKNFVKYLDNVEVQSRLRLDPKHVAALKAEIEEYVASCEEADRVNAGSVDRLDRREKGEKAKLSARHFINVYLRYNEALTDDDRVALGLTIRDRTQTAESDPKEYPTIVIGKRSLRQVVCRIFTPKRRLAKPPHVHATELFYGFIPDGETPKLEHLTNRKITTRSVTTLGFADEDRGLRVGICGRYQNHRGGCGAFGGIVEVYVP